MLTLYTCPILQKIYRQADQNPAKTALVETSGKTISYAALVQQIDTVIHCAGSVSDWGFYKAMYHVNRVGTAQVLKTFQNAGQFIHISTASVYDPFKPKIGLKEDAPSPSRYLNDQICHLNKNLAQLTGLGLQSLYRGLGLAKPPLITPYIVAQMASNCTLDLTKAQQQLGYCPPTIMSKVLTI